MEHRLDLAIDHDLVPEGALGVELVEVEQAIEVEAAVAEVQRIVVGAAGQSQRLGVGVVFIARI
ncbi:hypothetical protein D3C77_655490 [compost metagenome]